MHAGFPSTISPTRRHVCALCPAIPNTAPSWRCADVVWPKCIRHVLQTLASATRNFYTFFPALQNAASRWICVACCTISPMMFSVPECSVLRSMHAYSHGLMCDNPGTRTGSPLWARAQFLHFLSGSSKCGVALDLRRVMYNFPNDVYVPQCSVLRSMHAYSHGLMCDNPGTRTGSPLWAHARTQRHR